MNKENTFINSANPQSAIRNPQLKVSQNPPPYFPQSSLSPSDPNRYRKFKLIVAAIIAAVILLLAGAGIGVYYLVKWIF